MCETKKCTCTSLLQYHCGEFFLNAFCQNWYKKVSREQITTRNEIWRTQGGGVSGQYLARCDFNTWSSQSHYWLQSEERRGQPWSKPTLTSANGILPSVSTTSTRLPQHTNTLFPKNQPPSSVTHTWASTCLRESKHSFTHFPKNCETEMVFPSFKSPHLIHPLKFRDCTIQIHFWKGKTKSFSQPPVRLWKVITHLWP